MADTDPGQALEALLADASARVPRDVRDFLQVPPVEVVDVTSHYPAEFLSVGGSLARRLLAVTTQDHRHALLSLWGTKDGAARGVLIIGPVQKLPPGGAWEASPYWPHQYRGLPPAPPGADPECYDVPGTP
jgi:hypothetical protein